MSSCSPLADSVARPDRTSIKYHSNHTGQKDIYLAEVKANFKVPKDWTVNGSTQVRRSRVRPMIMLF